MKYVITIIVTIGILNSNLSQGIRFDRERFEANERWDEEELGFSSNLPSRFSMRKYCPPVMQQTGMSCVGWSSAYAALSVLYNMEYDITDEDEKFLHAFDPNFIYSLIANEGDIDCEEGTFFDDAMKVLQTYGCKKMFLPNQTSCNSVISDRSKSYGKPYRINTFYIPDENFYTSSIKEKTNTIKNVIAEKTPVIIGANTTASIAPLGSENGSVTNNGLWDPKDYEKVDGGHAMCVIGYDDYKFGGAFEIMNSWGSDYGDNGFNWIKYDDFFRLTQEIFIIEIYKPNKSSYDGYDCFLGDCATNYSHILLNDGIRYEGDFSYESLHGFGIIKQNNGDLFSGSFKNGEKHGYALYYVKEESKWYETQWEKGELADYSALGFSETELTESDLEMKNLIKGISNIGVINLSNQDELEDLDIEKSEPIIFKKK